MYTDFYFGTNFPDKIKENKYSQHNWFGAFFLINPRMYNRFSGFSTPIPWPKLSRQQKKPIQGQQSLL